MRKVRLYTQQALVPGEVVVLEARPAHHLVRVLRARPGDRLVLFNGDGWDCPAELLAAGPGCRLTVLSREAVHCESSLVIGLIQALGKPDRIDWCIQKSVELGVADIRLVETERTAMRTAADRADRRRARWQEIAIAASEQCGRAAVPAVQLAGRLDQCRFSAAHRLFLHPGGDLSPGGLSAPPDGRFELAVGPEGGFSQTEVDWLKRAGFEGLSLGPRILRMETAGPSALAILQARFGDMG